MITSPTVRRSESLKKQAKHVWESLDNETRWALYCGEIAYFELEVAKDVRPYVTRLLEDWIVFGDTGFSP